MRITQMALIALMVALLGPTQGLAQAEKQDRQKDSRKIDPNEFFDGLSKGKDVWLRSETSPAMQRLFDNFAEKMGVTDGKITRDQFVSYLNKRTTQIQALRKASEDAVIDDAVMKGSRKFDPNKFFDGLSKGKDVWLRSETSPAMQPLFDKLAEKMGITDGKITREQFVPDMNKRKARLEAARKTFEMKWKQAQAGGGPQHRVDADQLYRWSRHWLEAQREVSPNKADEVAALEAHKTRMQQLEPFIKQLAQAGALDVHPADSAAAEFYRLEAELWLARAKAEYQLLERLDKIEKRLDKIEKTKAPVELKK